MKSEWRTESLKNVVSYIAKGIPPTYVEVEGENTVRVLNQKCNRDFTINYSEARHHDLNRRSVSQEKYLRNDDILINSTGTGTAGRIAQINIVPCPTIIDGHMIVLRSNDKVRPRYLGYALKAQQATVLQLDEGSTGQTELNRDRLLAEIEVSYPVSLTHQDAIADMLFALDARIAENKKINQHLNQMAQAIFKSWFVDFEPFGGLMPDDWQKRTLDELCLLIAKGITPKYDDTTDQIVLNQKCIRNYAIDLTFARRHNPKLVNEKWLRFGDILINSTGEGTLGRAAQFLSDATNIVTDSHVTIIRPKEESLIPYLGLWCLSRESLFVSMSSGSTGQTDLPREQLKLLRVVLPDRNTLLEFAGVVTPLLQTRISVSEESLGLASLRDTLLPRLISDELSFSEVEPK
jgi:type I restriction enzyme S subunit